jgi:hypothetical protein
MLTQVKAAVYQGTILKSANASKGQGVQNSAAVEKDMSSTE